MCDSFAPEALRGNPAARTAWALEQLKLSASASRRMGLSDMGTFSGSFAWPYLFPFPQRPAGLIETAFEELARRWRRSEEHTSELQSQSNLVCRLLLEKKKQE